MEAVLIIMLGIGGVIVAFFWQRRWHQGHGGDRRNDLFDGSGGGL